jgi:hypothetical protein
VRLLGLSSYCGYGKLLQSAFLCKVLGHTGWIVRSYLPYLCNLRIQTCYHGGRGLRINIIREPCLAIIIPKIARLLSSIPHQSLSMGVKCRVHCLVFTTDDGVKFLLLHSRQKKFNHRVHDQRFRWE